MPDLCDCARPDPVPDPVPWVSLDGSGMLKLAPSLRTSYVNIKGGPEGGFNFLEFAMRVLDPVRKSVERIDFPLAKSEMLRQIRDLREQIPVRIDKLENIQFRQELLWVPRPKSI